MSDLSMSQFTSKENLEHARLDEGVTQISAAPGRLVATRLVCGVELKMVEEGSHWCLSVRKK